MPWGVDRVDAEVAHATATGAGADIAILDTGIDSDHPDLKANLATSNTAHKAFVKAKGRYAKPWDDDNGHGTHCAGIADAVDNDIGVSTRATLHAVKVLDKTGSGSWSNIAAGITWTADKGCDVASMSLGGGSNLIRDACHDAYARSVLLVVAAGNNGPCEECVSAPAIYRSVIAVSSTTKSDALSGFSSTGRQIELAAPGSGIYPTIPGSYGNKSGTSMACPHVGGAAALLMASGQPNAERIEFSSTNNLTDNTYCEPSQGSYEGPGGVRTQLRTTAENIGLSETEQGYGLLDAAAAVGVESTDDLG